MRKTQMGEHRASRSLVWPSNAISALHEVCNSSSKTQLHTSDLSCAPAWCLKVKVGPNMGLELEGQCQEEPTDGSMFVQSQVEVVPYVMACILHLEAWHEQAPETCPEHHRPFLSLEFASSKTANTRSRTSLLEKKKSVWSTGHLRRWPLRLPIRDNRKLGGEERIYVPPFFFFLLLLLVFFFPFPLLCNIEIDGSCSQIGPSI